MKRDLDRLADTTFDLAIVGAGIYGATIAWDAAARNLSVAIVDRGDFGAATSFNNHKTIHGGLRSLQQGNLREMREFIRERRALSRIVPHLVHPLPFLIPTLRHPLRSRAAMRAALTIHNLVGFDRNRLADPSKHLPAGRVISKDECLRLFPGLNPAEVTGGALWHDCQMYNTDRVTLSFLLSAAERGAVAVNYVEASGLLRDGNRVIGIRARDRLGGSELDLRARVVVNAAGPWALEFLESVPAARKGLAATRLSKAMNLVIAKRVATDRALGGLADSRFFFMLPWRDRNVVGTSHEPYDGSPAALTVTQRDVDRLLTDVNRAFPSAALSPHDVLLVHRGLLPMVSSNGTHVRLLKASQIRDHRTDGVPGLLSVVGVRYTTARLTAERVVDAVFPILGRPRSPSRSAAIPLVGGDIPRFDDFLQSVISRSDTPVEAAALRRLALSYGTGHHAVLSRIVQTPEEGRPLGSACAVTRAEIRHAVRSEMAVKLADAVLRRTEAGSGGHPGVDALRAAGLVMAEELGWTTDRLDREVAEVEDVYRISDR